MTSEDGRDEGAPSRQDDGFFAGPSSTFVATRDKTRDNGDGTATISFMVDAAVVPRDFASSPLHSVWSLYVQTPKRQHRLTASREVLQDKERGRVMLRFAVFASSHQPEAVYGNKGEEVMLTINLIAKQNNHPFMSTAASRHSVMQRCVMMCEEPGFGQWVAEQCRREGYPTIEGPVLAPSEEVGGDVEGGHTVHQRRAVEHLYRLAQIHSRADVLDNNAAAGRVEDVMRRYRAHLWDTRARDRRGGRKD